MLLTNIPPRFLLVALNIEAILGETSLARRKKMLRKVATTGVDLDSVYAQTLQRIREQKGDRSRLGIEVLMWVSHAERPLRIDELRHALAVEMDSADLDPENIRPQDTVLGSCLGLAVVDAETSTVRLIHYTLQEYLSRPGILPNVHQALIESCLAYLNYEQVKGLPVSEVPNLGAMPFLEYSSLYWGSHAKAGLSDRAKFLALELLNQDSNHISSTLLVKHIDAFHSCWLPHHIWPGLHCASYFGIVEAVAALIGGEGCDINQSDCMGFTALIWATRQGNEEVVKLLLARNDVNADKPDKSGGTPLWWASVNGHDGVVKLLLARNDVNADKPDNNGETQLSCASMKGHEGVVKLLLSRNDVNADKPDNNGGTPLWWASFNGHERVVKLLLARKDVNADKPNKYGRTPLWWASSHGHEGVVKLLLARNDVNADRPGEDGETPLWTASCAGHVGVVRLLLARDDVDPNKPNNNGRAPLLIASLRRNTEIVALLQPRVAPVSLD